MSAIERINKEGEYIRDCFEPTICVAGLAIYSTADPRLIAVVDLSTNRSILRTGFLILGYIGRRVHCAHFKREPTWDEFVDTFERKYPAAETTAINEPSRWWSGPRD